MNNHEAPDQCPECDAEQWSDVQFWIDGAEGRMCMTCGRIERRCRTGHWLSCEAVTRDHFCVPCTERRERPEHTFVTRGRAHA